MPIAIAWLIPAGTSTGFAVRRFRWYLMLCSVAFLAGCGGSANHPGLASQNPAAPTDSISGTVTVNGAPLAGVTITLWSTNNNRIAGTAITGDNGAYSFSGISTTGNATSEYHLWAGKSGYGFHPYVSAGAKVIRADHTGDFIQAQNYGVPIYLEVIDYLALPDASLNGANFLAYDGKTPLVKLAASGQTAIYASGDDGAQRRGLVSAAIRFTNNQNGTVTDSLTGLTWLKDAGCLPPGNWSSSLAEVNALAGGACGLSDGSTAGQWRLPNVAELESLIDVSASSPAIPPGSPFVNVSNSAYWTSTSYFGGQAGSLNAWAIRMEDGSYLNDSYLNLKASSTNAVWAVSGNGNGPARLQVTGLFIPYEKGDDGTVLAGVPLVYPRFVQKSDGTVVDLMTGLVWLKKADCIYGDWATAIAEANTLASGQCGLTDGSVAGDWRMPNRREMQSLADRNQNNEADFFDTTFLRADLSVFHAAIFGSFIPGQYYWTASTDAADTNQAWVIFSCDYGVYAAIKSSGGYSLAVRQP